MSLSSPIPAREAPSARGWVSWAVEQVEADFHRSADTHLITLPVASYQSAGIDFYFKDESTHPTGSLKHRLARSLFLYALCNGWIERDTPVVERSEERRVGKEC